ncbi:GT2 family glycosyltransferase [Novosphingobium sp. SG707]|nr:GT2 family glycosyltransferase [Novosphingobium sp. SG707]
MAIVIMPRITVITVTLNAGRDLPLTLESILGQTYPSLETLIVDGYSWDDTHAVLKRYADRLGRVMMIEDGGIYQAMNAAVQAAEGEYVLFLNAGDRFYRADTVETIVGRMMDRPDVVYGDHIYVEGRVERYVRSADFDWLWHRLQQGRIDQKWHTAIPGHQATFTRTQWLRDMPYDTRYTICADHDFLFRARAAGARMQYIDEIVCHYMAGGMSGAQGVRIHREWAHAYRKHSLRPLAVDSFFFATPLASPFPTFSAASGRILEGAGPEIRLEPSDQRWRRADEPTVSAPRGMETVGIEIRGVSPTPDQTLVIAHDQELLGAERLVSGGFALRMAFIAPLAAGEEITLNMQMPASASGAKDWGLETLHFLACTALTGNWLDLLSADPQQVADIFLDGWHAPEWCDEGDEGDGRAIIWSNVEQASLAFSLSAHIKTLTLFVEGHGGNREGQELSIIINGVIAGSTRLEAGHGPQRHRVAVSNLWREGANIIRLCVDHLAHDASRHQWRGLGLGRIEWE